MITPFGVVSNGEQIRLNNRTNEKNYSSIFFLWYSIGMRAKNVGFPAVFLIILRRKRVGNFYLKVFRRNGAPVGGGARQPPPKKTLVYTLRQGSR